MKYFLSVCLMAVSLPAFASDPYRDFATYADADSLKPFARDLGALVGAGTFTSGRGLGFAGFDVGVRGAMQFAPSNGNNIMKKAGVGAFSMPWVQAEIGMPFRIDGFIRGTSSQGLTVSGGGFKWAITRLNDKLYALQAMVVVSGHAIVHQAFSATHFGGGLVVSCKMPWFIPFAGFGVDRTRVEVHQATTNPSAVGSAALAYATRMTLGLTFRPSKLSYISVAGSLIDAKNPGISSSLGLRF